MAQFFDTLSLSVLVFALSVLLISALLKLTAHYTQGCHCEARRLQLWTALCVPWLNALLALLLMGYLAAQPLPYDPQVFEHRVFSSVFNDDSNSKLNLAELPAESNQPALTVTPANAYNFIDTFPAEFFHWHHQHNFHWRSWHGMALLLAALFSLYFFQRALKAGWRHWRQHKRSQLLATFALNAGASADSDIFPHPQPMAYTAGLLKPEVYISSALAQQLTAAELELVRRHERGHQRRRDPLQKWWLAFLAAFFPRRTGASIQQQMALMMECSADQYAVANSDDAERLYQLAQLMVKIARLKPVATIAPGCNYLSVGEQLEQRIQYLLAPYPKSQPPATPALLISLMQLLLPLAVSLLTLDFFHHQLDLWLWH